MMLIARLVGWIILVSIGVLVTACGSESAGQQIEATTATAEQKAEVATTAVQQETEAATAPVEPTITGATPLSETCADQADVERTIENYLAAFNQGDMAQLEETFPTQSADYDRTQTLIPERDTFQLYSVIGGGLDGFGGDNREEVLEYLEQRIAQHEQLQLVTLQVLPYYEYGAG